MVDIKSHDMLEQPQKIEGLTMEKSSIQEVYQQVTDAEIGWLAGIIDGEGSIGINGRRDESGKYRYKNFIPVMQLSNTSPDMINKVVDIFNKMGVKYYMQSHRLSYVNPNHQDVYKVIIGRQTQMKLFLENIIPHLVVKKGQAQLTLKFINMRLSRGAKQGDGKNCPYSTDEMDIAQQVYELNCQSNHRFRRRESSTTMSESALISA